MDEKQDWVERHNKVAAQLDAFLTEIIPQLYCGECDRYERDPIFLDVERCGKCGELIEMPETTTSEPGNGPISSAPKDGEAR